MDYFKKEIRDNLVKGFEFGNTIDICVVTYNRLVYLQKCINSIIASTSVKYNLYVIDDSSTDGSVEWLKKMEKDGKIHHLVLNNKNKGTANNFNEIIRLSKSKVFVMANDDMYFHRYWDLAVIEIMSKFNDCGIVSFYDYARYNLDEGVEKINDNTLKVPRTGLGATLMTREIFELTGGFYLPEGKKMGYFATPFCVKSGKVNITRNKHYGTIPNYAIHMDDPSSKLNERKVLDEYLKMRQKEKR